MNYLQRKKWAIMRAGNFHGYLRRSEGYPLTLTDCMAEYPVSLSVSGNTVQDSTPAPDNPVEVQGCGDRTANLFTGFIYDKKSISTSTGMLNNSSSIVVRSDFIKIEPDKTYYWKLPDGITTSDFTSGVLHGYTEADGTTWCGRSTNNDMTNYGVNSHIVKLGSRITTNIPSDAGEINYVRFNFICATADVKNKLLSEQSYLIEGSTLVDEPYGYKLPLLLSNSDGETCTFPIYTDAPLYGNGDISDTVELDVRNKAATRIDRISVDDSGNITLLAESVTTDISNMQDWDSIPQFWRGTVIITADTTVPPSGMNAMWYAKTPGDAILGDMLLGVQLLT
ncbi:MAG: hypothetical protein ACI4DP_00895 [Candidatus Ornithomonoglobus sp.]